jgi:hypothetical protein
MHPDQKRTFLSGIEHHQGALKRLVNRPLHTTVLLDQFIFAS